MKDQATVSTATSPPLASARLSPSPTSHCHLLEPTDPDAASDSQGSFILPSSSFSSCDTLPELQDVVYPSTLGAMGVSGSDLESVLSDRDISFEDLQGASFALPQGSPAVTLDGAVDRSSTDQHDVGGAGDDTAGTTANEDNRDMEDFVFVNEDDSSLQ